MRIDAISQNSTTIGRTKPTGAAAFNVQLVKNLATRSEASATAALSWCKLILQRAHSDAAWTPASASVFASMCEFMREQLEKARVDADALRRLAQEYAEGWK
jgi:hypothetical protein